MSIYSTMAITRQDCIDEIKKNLDQSSDEALEEALFELVGKKSYHNFTIVASYQYAGNFPFSYRKSDPEEIDESKF